MVQVYELLGHNPVREVSLRTRSGNLQPASLHFPEHHGNQESLPLHPKRPRSEVHSNALHWGAASSPGEGGVSRQAVGGQEGWRGSAFPQQGLCACRRGEREAG